MLSHVVDLTHSLSTPPNSRRDDQTHAQLASPVPLVDVDAVHDNAVEVVSASSTRAERDATSEVSHIDASMAHGKTKCELVRPCRLFVGIDPDTFGTLAAIEEDSQRVHIIPTCHVINGKRSLPCTRSIAKTVQDLCKDFSPENIHAFIETSGV